MVREEGDFCDFCSYFLRKSRWVRTKSQVKNNPHIIAYYMSESLIIAVASVSWAKKASEE